METQTRDIYDDYIDDVLAGKIVVSDYVLLAVKRCVKDLKSSTKKNYPYYFDRAEATWVCNCFALFKHTSGEFAGKPFILMPWQRFIIGQIFGWKRKDNKTRRFRRVYIEVSRRQGKSTLLAGVALFLLLLDGEPSAQVYSAATKREQAKIVWNEARKMVKSSPDLLKEVKLYRDSMIVSNTESSFIPLASDSKGLDGLNISGAVIDELHAHPTPDVWELIDTATASREQPLVCVITTAGFDQNGICYEIRKMGTEILEGNAKNDEWFYFIACISPDDNYADESIWEKANPNLRYIKTLLPDLREKASRASMSAGAMNNFLVKCLCRWTSQGVRWLKLEDWDKCKTTTPYTYQDLLGRPCFIGVDLAEKLDLTAVCLCFPPVEKDEKWKYIWRFYLPEDTIEKHTANRDFRWQQWVQSGELISTPGRVTDQSIVREDINTFAKDFDLQQVGFDPYHMNRLSSELLDDGIEMVEIPQRIGTLTEATKEFEAQIVSQGMEHNGGSLMRWQVNNVALSSDGKGNHMPCRPEKKRNDSKVDGVLAAVMACTCAIRNPIQQEASIGFFF